MAEAIYKARKMDAEIQKREQELRKVLAKKAKIKGENLLKKAENEANRRYKLVRLEAKE